MKEQFAGELRLLAFTAPEKAMLPNRSGQTLHFLGETLKSRTNNLHYRKAVSLAVFLAHG